MAFKIDSLADLVGRARSAFRAYIPGSDAWLWPNNLYASAKVIAGMVYEVFGFADYIAKQKFAGEADGENLDLHAQEFGLSRRPAAPAVGTVTITCAGALSVDVGAVFQRGDAVEYVASASASVLSAGTLDVPVIAATDGAITNANPGTSVAILSGVTDAAGGATAVVGSAGIVGGVDVEPDGELWTTDLGTLRGRILFRKRNPPHGGNAADYVQWATSVSGVTRVFVERLWSGAGTVRVFPLMDDLYPADGVPSSADIARVAYYVETQRPSGAIVTVTAPARVPVNITISGLTPDTPDTREAVLAELRDTFRRLSRVAGIDDPHPAMPYLATAYSFPRGWIWQAVGNAGGVISDAVTSPSADVSLTPGQFPTLGTVTFT